MKTLSTILFIASIAVVCSCREKYEPPIIDPGPLKDTFLLVRGSYSGTFTSFDMASGNGPNYDSTTTISSTITVNNITGDSIWLRRDTVDIRLKRPNDTASYYGFITSPVEYRKVYIKGDSIFFDERNFDFRGNNSWRRSWGSTGRWKKLN